MPEREQAHGANTEAVTPGTQATETSRAPRRSGVDDPSDRPELVGKEKPDGEVVGVEEERREAL